MLGSLLLAALIPLGGQAVTDPAATEGTGGLGIDRRPAAILVEPRMPIAQRIEFVAFGADLQRAELRYPVWTLAEYADMGEPRSYLTELARVVEPWGNAGLAGAFRDTYRVTAAVQGGVRHYSDPMVIGVESLTPGVRLAGAQPTRDATYLGAVWQTADGVRGLLPFSITWALDVWAGPINAEIVPLTFGQWESGFGVRFDGGDLLAWQRTAAPHNPEPPTIVLVLVGVLLCRWN